VHNHLDERNGADSYMLEVVGVGLPRLLRGCGLVGFCIVVVEGVAFGINQLDIVVQL
jgi:hypothetical protein